MIVKPRIFRQWIVNDYWQTINLVTETNITNIDQEADFCIGFVLLQTFLRRFWGKHVKQYKNVLNRVIYIFRV